MPKIECNEKLFFQSLGKKYDYDALEEILPWAKAELDEKPDMSLPEDERVVKIELNDTNRPDLWSTNGVARQLRIHQGGKTADYEKFLSTKDKILDCENRIVIVDESSRMFDVPSLSNQFVNLYSGGNVTVNIYFSPILAL